MNERKKSINDTLIYIQMQILKPKTRRRKKSTTTTTFSQIGENNGKSGVRAFKEGSRGRGREKPAPSVCALFFNIDRQFFITSYIVIT